MLRKKIIAFVILIAILQYLLIVFSPITINKSYATDMDKGTLSRDINAIDDGLYPGYKSLIQNMQNNHPNYTFLVYYTGMDWNEVLTAEYQGHGHAPRNLFQMGNNYDGMWICPLCGTQKYDNGTWCCPSLEALAYMMDPRNSINDTDVFQFKDLESADASYDDIARVVSRYGSFINNQEVIQAIVDAANQYRINAYFLVAKIINEHGSNGSTLSNGNGYNGSYAGVYNYFNLGATGNGKEKVIMNGLKYAQDHGWTSRRASIFGGTEIVRNSYMNEYSQNTFYYQKFNVSGRSSMASHQYQQNIMAAQTQGTSFKSYYTSLDGNHTFIIPLFKNIPSTVSPRPNVSVANTINYENGVVQNISSSLTVRAAGRKSGTAIGALNNNESIKILQRAGSEVDGYYWDLIVSNQDGTYGYAARSTDGNQHINSIGSSGSNSGTASANPTPPAPSAPAQPSGPSIEEPNPATPSVDLENDIKVTDTSINVLPNISCENIKTKFADAEIKKSTGEVVTSGNLGTGFSITTGGKTYKVIKKGDVDGNGETTVTDGVLILNAIKGEYKLENEFEIAAKVRNQAEYTVTDVVFILNYIKGAEKLSL